MNALAGFVSGHGEAPLRQALAYTGESLLIVPTLEDAAALAQAVGGAPASLPPPYGLANALRFS